MRWGAGMSVNVKLYCGDNRVSLRRLIDEGVRVHSVVTDPPYGLTSIEKRFGREGAAAARTEGNDGSFGRLSAGFMGKVWDGTGIERDPEFWRLIWEILLPGGYCFAFSGSRTGHWQACAMEQAGFVMHPMHGWVTGQGFPKAKNVGCCCAKNIHRRGSQAEHNLRDMLEADLSEAEAYRDGAEVLQQRMPEQGAPELRTERSEPQSGRTQQPGMERRRDLQEEQGQLYRPEVCQVSSGVHGNGSEGRVCHGASLGDGEASWPMPNPEGGRSPHQPSDTGQSHRKSDALSRQCDAQAGRSETCPTCGGLIAWQGWAYGTQAQKPALEPIYLGQKPFSEKTGAANLLKHGVGAVNIDGCRVPTNPEVDDPRLGGNGDWGTDKAAKNVYEGGYAGVRVSSSSLGRHPANLILDGSPEVVAMFPNDNARFFHQFPPDTDPVIYQSKAGKEDRAGSKHPTVKPVALMQYLIRHITPPGGTVLDPFAGSGTTGEAAKREGFDCILMEAEDEYVEFLRHRFTGDFFCNVEVHDASRGA